LLPVHVVRKANDSSVVTIYPPLELARSGNREADVQAGTAQIAGILEGMIRKTPEQWVVLQPVWPDDPPATPAPASKEATPPAEDVPDRQLTRA
jgi:KDO2-lipid IV(A) lauroyltransferase